MERNQKSFLKYLGPISLGAVMFCTYVGPGFATGTQTVAYFLTKGSMGVFWGPIVVGFIALCINLLQFEVVRIYKPVDYLDTYKKIYTGKVSKIIIPFLKDFLFCVTILVSISAQISAASILLNDFLGIPVLVATVLFSVLIIVLALGGAKFLRILGSFLTFCIVGVCLYIAVMGIGIAWPHTMEFVRSQIPASEFGFSNASAWFIIISFVTNFLCGFDAAVPTALGVVNTRRDVVISAFSTALLCTLATMVFTIVFAASMPDISKEPIPTLWTIRNIIGGGLGAQILYAILALSAMISTGVNLLFAASGRFQRPLAKVWKNSSEVIRKSGIALIFILICTVGSSYGILNIVRYGFTFMTTLTLLIILLPLLATIPYRLWKDKLDGVRPDLITSPGKDMP